MVQIDIPAAFIVSQLILDIGRKYIKKEAQNASSSDGRPSVYYQYLFRSVFFAGFVIAPAGIYLLTGWPGWEQIYWTELVEQPQYGVFKAMLYALFIMAIVFSAYLGHVIGYKWLTTGKERYLRPTYIILLIAVSVIVLANYPAFTVVGTYAEYHSNWRAMGRAWNNPHNFSIGWLIVMAYFSISFVCLLCAVRKDNKRA